MPASTMPPPSSTLPKPGGSGPYVAGIVAFAALIAGLIYWKTKAERPSAPIPVTVPANSPQNTVPQLVNAPPPPPKIDEPDAGVDAGVKAATSGAIKGSGPCAAKCEGTSSAALEAAVRSNASSAQGCYNRALRSSAVSGSMTVSVQVGANGAVCGASVVNDSVGSSEIRSCVLSRFQGKTFPPPSNGCVVVNIPIAFKIKE